VRSGTWIIIKEGSLNRISSILSQRIDRVSHANPTTGGHDTSQGGDKSYDFPAREKWVGAFACSDWGIAGYVVTGIMRHRAVLNQAGGRADESE
jgi:hypothetical protein